MHWCVVWVGYLGFESLGLFGVFCLVVWYLLVFVFVLILRFFFLLGLLGVGCFFCFVFYCEIVL